MDVIDSIEESLLNLDQVFEKEGLTPLDAYRIKAILENLTKNEVVLTLENLISDQTAMSEIILKIHYVKELLDVNSDSLSSDMIQVLNSLQHISTNSIKFLTPDDIRFLLITFPTNRRNTLISSEENSTQLEVIKKCKDELLKKSSQNTERETAVKLRIAKLEAQATELKEHILPHIKNATTLPVPPSHSQNSPSLLWTQKTVFNKTAENRILQLDFDAALTALSTEVNKLEKKLVYQRSDEEEYQVSYLLNDLLMLQIEMAEESRLHADKIGSQIKTLSSQYHNEYRQHQLNSAIQRSINLSNSVDTTYEETQRDFEKKYNKIREKYNNLLESENIKNISMMRNLSTSLSRTLDTTAKQLTNEYSQRSELIHSSIDSIVDKLHGQVTVDTEAFANNFSKVYSTATLMLQENREKNASLFLHNNDYDTIHSTSSQNGNNNGNLQTNNSSLECKPSLQTTVYDAFTSIHEIQVSTGIQPTENFTKILQSIIEEQDNDCQVFLKKADETLKIYRKILLENAMKQK